MDTEYHLFVDGEAGPCGAILRHIEPSRGGRTTNAHWARDGVVVKSDWCGAQSFVVDDREGALEGLDDEVVARIQEFVAQRPSEPAPGHGA